MGKVKIYISGKISGLPNYAEKFAAAEAELTEQGYDVINPLNNGVASGEPWHVQMKADIRLLLNCDAIFMLDNWEKSIGAVLEHDLAFYLGLSITYQRPPKHRDIKEAIQTAMNVTFKEIAEDDRKRWLVYARMIYAHHCNKRGENTQKIAEETSHDPSTISYYLRRYDSEYKYNREFRAAAEKVATLLSPKLSNPENVLK